MVLYKFTQGVFDKISLLLELRFTQSPDKQKNTRARIRKLGFNISAHHTGFSAVNLKQLLANGQVEISHIPDVAIKSTSSKPENELIKDITKSVHLKKSMPPVINDDTAYLILGTMPGEISIQTQEYYCNPRNQFWTIISHVFNDGKSFLNYEEKLRILKKNKIGLWDVIDTCERKGSLDLNIKNRVHNNFDRIFSDYPNIKVVMFNGKDSFKYFRSVVDNRTDKKFIQLNSTSSANTIYVSKKIEEWKMAFLGNG